MTKEHDLFLNRLEMRSREQQQMFIGNIKQRLGRSSANSKPPQHPYKGAPEFWKEFDLELHDRVQLFKDNWQRAGGHTARLKDMQEAKEFIVSLSNELEAKLLMMQNQEELNELEIEQSLPGTEVVVWHAEQPMDRVAAAAGANIGVVVVDHAAAYTGSIVVTSSADKGRSVSLLPTVMIAIVPVERLYTRVGQVLAHYDGSPREKMPAGIHFISGPSRSADIENDLTIGVHGPGVVYALIVG